MYYTLKEAATVLRIPAGTLRQHRREIGFSKLGKRLIFHESDLNQWVESRRHKSVRELQTA